MTENEFNELADAVFDRTEQGIDASDADIECNLNGPVLELEFADGSQIVINRHAPNRRSGSLPNPAVFTMRIKMVSGSANVMGVSCSAS